jgi:hypothetical protein
VRPKSFPVIGRVPKYFVETFIFGEALICGATGVGVGLVGDATVVLGEGTVDVDGVVVVVLAGGIVLFEVIVNIAPAAIGDMTKSPAAVHFPGDAHETEEKVEGEKESDCTPLANTAGRAISHTPFIDVMVKAALWL